MLTSWKGRFTVEMFLMCVSPIGWVDLLARAAKVSAVYFTFLLKQHLAAEQQSQQHPPSLILKQFFNELKGKEACATAINEVAQRILLPPEKVQFWLQHLTTVADNHKGRAERAAVTRSRKSVRVGLAARPLIHSCKQLRALLGTLYPGHHQLRPGLLHRLSGDPTSSASEQLGQEVMGCHAPEPID